MKNLVKAIIKNNNKYLLIKRGDGAHFFSEMWDFPGGKIDSGESPEQAMVREAMEEVNLNIELGERLGEYDYVKHDTPLHFQVFAINSFTGEVKLSKDHTEFMWVDKEDLKLYDLAPIVKTYFEE